MKQDASQKIVAKKRESVKNADDKNTKNEAKKKRTDIRDEKELKKKTSGTKHKKKSTMKTLENEKYVPGVGAASNAGDVGKKK